MGVSELAVNAVKFNKIHSDTITEFTDSFFSHVHSNQKSSVINCEPEIYPLNMLAHTPKRWKKLNIWSEMIRMWKKNYIMGKIERATLNSNGGKRNNRGSGLINKLISVRVIQSEVFMGRRRSVGGEGRVVGEKIPLFVLMCEIQPKALKWCMVSACKCYSHLSWSGPSITFTVTVFPEGCNQGKLKDTSYQGDAFELSMFHWQYSSALLSSETLSYVPPLCNGS